MRSSTPRWDAEAARWRIQTSRGPVSARVLIASAGPLHEPKLPEIAGLDRFEGEVFHSAAWNHDHELGGERVAVIGTGASAIQFVPQIQARVERLHVFQRTAPWVFPRTNRAFTRFESCSTVACRPRSGWRARASTGRGSCSRSRCCASPWRRR